MEIKRRGSRFTVDIAITITTVLDSVEARIIDMSEHGAQIVGASVAKGAKVQIEYMDQIVYAQCMWSEVDRMGVRFPFDLTDGPLHDAMMMTGASAGMGQDGFASAPVSYSAMTPRRPGAGGFGRRNSM